MSNHRSTNHDAAPPTPVADALWAADLESIAPVLDRVARLVKASTGAPSCFVTLLSDGRLRVLGAASGNVLPVQAGHVVPSIATLCIDVVGTGQALLVADVESDPRYADHPAIAHGLAAYAGVPLVVAGECIGAVCAVDDMPHAWTEQDALVLADLEVLASHELELLRASEEQARLVAALQASEEELRRLAAQLARLAESDDLTGLANRRAFSTRLADEARRADRHGRPLSLVTFDIDHFKAINDQFGHPAGDEVLTTFARRLQSLTREGEMLARIGGEEFAWLMPETDADGAVAAAERARTAIADELFGGVGTVTTSAGVCEYVHAGTTEELVRRADAALYRAKRQGRNRTARHEPPVAGPWPEPQDEVAPAKEPAPLEAFRALLLALAAGRDSTPAEPRPAKPAPRPEDAPRPVRRFRSTRGTSTSPVPDGSTGRFSR